MAEPILSVRDLHVRFDDGDRTVRSVDGVSFDVERGGTACLVGETGSGKTVTCESLTGLTRPDATVSGEVRFAGEDLVDLSEDRLRRIRGNRIAHVFQNPQHTLDPVYTIGDQIAEAITFHRDVDDADARERVIDLLDRVGIPNAEQRVDDYPHEFSGGMKQRVAIAMALASDPDLLVADEPTTAVDVTTQAQLLNLVTEVQHERDMAVVFVTHDMGIVANVADWVAVMYAGKIMEQGSVEDVFTDPGHPYTRALLQCLPSRGDEIKPIGGDLPDPHQPPDGCRFHPRCRHAVEACQSGDQPPFEPVGADGHEASCVWYGPDFDAAELWGEADA